MNIKTLAICTYIMVIYWFSLHFSFLDTLFFPTLGAFSFLFVSRSLRYAEIARITLGAFIMSIIGNVLFHIYPSAISVFLNVLIAFWLIRKFKWNAPPIVAVSLIPFFSHSTHLWVIPFSVTGVLLGLMLTLFIAERLESKFGHLWAGKKLSSKSDSIDASA
ncbi:HPP family protein [Paenibacillus sp. NPDC058071]|uniref:HPP family protein n=1 Tax=Paenibacillus sp. NPDC058071 TaxID=3346326 RepID=UPI0036DB30EA